MPKNIKKIYLHVSLILIVFLISYLCLIVGDYYLQRIISLEAANSLSEAKNIESERILKEDIPQKKLAVQEGYKALFFPEAIDTYLPLKKLAKEMDAVPLAPQPNSKLYFCNEGYGLIKYETDRFGFRNQDRIWDEKIDLILIGDSFAHGACVKEEDSIAFQLGSKFKLINLATYGNHAIHYAALEKIFIPLLKPKYVVTIFYANDNEDDKDSLIYEYYFVKNKKYFEYENDKLHLTKNILDFYTNSEYLIETLLTDNSPQEFIKIFSQISSLEKSLKYFSLPTIRRTLNNYLKTEGWNSKLPSSNLLAIDLLASECLKIGCTPIIGYIPNNNFWRPDARSANYARMLGDYSRSKNITYIDFTNILQASGSESYAPEGYHLSPEGYKLVSKSILNNLKK